MRLHTLLAVILTGAAVTGVAQAPDGRVTGVVRDAETKAPIAGARVRIAASNYEWCHPCVELVDSPAVATDGRGRFVLEHPPETFIVEADHAGYAVGGFGARRPAARPARIDLAPGQNLNDLEIVLFREAVVRGRVEDEGGRPVVDTEVWLSRVDTRGYWRYYRGMDGVATPAITDARGYYTAYAAPGRYAVTVLRNQEPIFHPSAQSVKDASLISLQPGEVRDGVNLRLWAGRVGAVHARFALPTEDGAKFSANALLRNEQIGIPGWGKDGVISFTDVPYGDYTLEVTFNRFGTSRAAVEWWASTPVAVSAPSVGPVDVVPRPALQLSGTVISEGAVATVGVGLETALDPFPCGRSRSREDIAKDRSFLLRVVPGEYRLCVWPSNRFGWADARRQGQDLADLPFMASESVNDIQVILSDPPSKLSGSVRDVANRPIREGWVVVFPADRRFWPYARKESGRFWAEPVSIAGTFEIDALLPGQYLIAAVDDVSMDGWPDGTWLARVAENAQTLALDTAQNAATQPLVARSVPVTPPSPPRTYQWWNSLAGFIQPNAVQSSNPRFFVEGTVRDSAGRPAGRATVGWRKNDSIWLGFEQVLTDSAGRYRLSGLEPGSYTLIAEGDVGFRTEPLRIEDGRVAKAMTVTELSEIDTTITRNQLIDFTLKRARRPHFAGQWMLDVKNSSTAISKSGGLRAGPPAASLSVYHKTETINWGEDGIYRTDGSNNPIVFGAGPSRVEVEAVSRWRDERLITRWTVPASVNGPAETYEEARWLDRDGAMIVELRGPGGSMLRRSVYRR